MRKEGQRVAKEEEQGALLLAGDRVDHSRCCECHPHRSTGTLSMASIRTSLEAQPQLKLPLSCISIVTLYHLLVHTSKREATSEQTWVAHFK